MAPHVHLAAHSAFELREATLSATAASEATALAEEIERKKKRKRAKDPNAPKRPIPAYVLFVKSQYQKIAEDNPELKPKDVMVILGAHWRDLTDTQKQVVYNLTCFD